MRGSDQPVNRSPTSKGVSDGSGKLASQSGVAPASAFFLRAVKKHRTKLAYIECACVALMVRVGLGASCYRD